MNLEQLENTTILLLGKSRAFTTDEFDAQMKFHKIRVVKENDVLPEDLALIVEGKMMTPYEQIKSDTLYEQKKAPFLSIDILEKELARKIDADTLLMSIKLSRDSKRLIGCIKNQAFEDAFFLRLLKLYDFKGEDFFENDDNRDVSAALIERFYENIERNHNVQYATLGLMHLVAQTKDPVLLETLVNLEPLQKALGSEEKNTNHSILLSIARHPWATQEILGLFVKKGSKELQRSVALREDCNEHLQKKLFERQDESLHKALSYNKNLSHELVEHFLQENKYVNNIAMYRMLDGMIFDLLFERFAKFLACNPSLELWMQEKLLQTQDKEVLAALAQNQYIDPFIMQKLFEQKDEMLLYALYANEQASQEQLQEALEDTKYHLSLACNKNTPPDLLAQLALTHDSEVLSALAKNTNTPIEILYQLQLDSRFERFVKENPTFGKYIQTQNIGWLV